MKISKTAVLALGGVIATAGLGLMVVSAATDYEKGLFMNLDNAVQHFEKIKFISGTTTPSVVYMKKGGTNVSLVEIDANNFAMTQTGLNEKNIIEGGNGNTILGGIKNKIKGYSNVILGGSDNIIEADYYNVILGGVGNRITDKTASTIVGGFKNKATNFYSTIIGNNNNANGAYSVVIGDNNTVGGKNSVALGSHATVNGANSFLWSDGSSATVGNGDVFAVNAASGMVVGATKAHSFSKLTIGGSLVVLQKDLPTCNSIYKGVLKVKASSAAGRVCFCSCDGTTWNSLHGGGICTSVCDANRSDPDCNNEGAVITCAGGNVYTITNGCKKGQIVKGTGAFLIDKSDKIHWTCEEENGNTVVCESANVPACNVTVPGPECSKTTAYECVWPASANKVELRKNYGHNDLGDRWTWVCEYGSIKKDCTLLKVINGVCGGTHYNCTAGNSIENNYSANKWTWKCQGINGGTTVNCTENEKINGACSATHYGCTAGTSSNNKETSTQYTWQCVGTNGGTTANCTENRSCGGTKPEGNGVIIVDSNPGNGVSEWQYAGTSTHVHGCQWTCKGGYHINSDETECIKDVVYPTCGTVKMGRKNGNTFYETAIDWDNACPGDDDYLISSSKNENGRASENGCGAQAYRWKCKNNDSGLESSCYSAKKMGYFDVNFQKATSLETSTYSRLGKVTISRMFGLGKFAFRVRITDSNGHKSEIDLSMAGNVQSETYTLRYNNGLSANTYMYGVNGDNRTIDVGGLDSSVTKIEFLKVQDQVEIIGYSKGIDAISFHKDEAGNSSCPAYDNIIF